MDAAAAGQVRGAGGAGLGGELAVADGGVNQDDVLGVDQAGGAGGGDRVAGQVGELAAGGGVCGDDREDPAGAEHPLAGGVQQPRAGLTAGLRPGAAAGAVAAGDSKSGLAGVWVPGREQQVRAAGPQPG